MFLNVSAKEDAIFIRKALSVLAACTAVAGKEAFNQNAKGRSLAIVLNAH